MAKWRSKQFPVHIIHWSITWALSCSPGVNMLGKLSEYVRHVLSKMTVEPVVAMYCLIIALSGIPGEELYLKKACTVNLNSWRSVTIFITIRRIRLKHRGWCQEFRSALDIPL